MQAIAVLGSIELTSVLAIGLFVYLWRTGFAREAWALLAFPAVLLVQVAYRRLVLQPAPQAFAHPDAPSITGLFALTQRIPNSFPSGHMLRAVLVYGLLAFVVHRLAPPGPVRQLAIPAAVLLMAAVAFDRLYLGVHWQSDVLGGILLGGLALAAAIAWLDWGSAH
jgi:membrane-associated phospholipid phosphatase